MKNLGEKKGFNGANKENMKTKTTHGLLTSELTETKNVKLQFHSIHLNIDIKYRHRLLRSKQF